MITISPVLFHRPKKDGTYPLAIRVTKDRKSSYVFLGHTMEKSMWDKTHKKVTRRHPNSARLNALIAKKVAEINSLNIENDLKDNKKTAQDIHKAATNDKKDSAFFIWADEYLRELRAEGQYARYNADKGRIRVMREFFNEKDIAFKDLTEVQLRRLKAFLKGSRKVSERTVICYLVVVRTLFNRAIRAGVVDAKYYPFGKGGISLKVPESVKLGLSRKEIQSIEDADLRDYPKEHHARNVFLYSFYFAGMRISDVLRTRWSDFSDDRLLYRMGKNEKPGSLKIPDRALAILDEYRPLSRKPVDFVFPELKPFIDVEDKYFLTRKISYATKNLNKYLKRLAERLEIEKKLTTHIARHSFGNLSGDTIPIQMLQKLYRHSDVTTTIKYQKAFIHKDADDALDAVLNG